MTHSGKNIFNNLKNQDYHFEHNFSHRYTHSVWDLGLNVRHIYFMARQNDAE